MKNTTFLQTFFVEKEFRRWVSPVGCLLFLLMGQMGFAQTVLTFDGGVGTQYLGTVTTTSASSCPGTLVIEVPAGQQIATATTQYSIIAKTAAASGAGAAAYMSEQRSYLYSPTALQGEASVVAGAGSSAGTQAYTRSVPFLQGLSGNVTVELRAFRTWEGITGCNQTVQAVVAGTWKLTLTFEPLATCVPPTALALTPGSVTDTAAGVNFTASVTIPADGYQYYYSTTNTAPTPDTPASGTIAGTSGIIEGLTSNTTYFVWVRSNCGGGDVSAWTNSSVTFKTLCSVLTPPTSLETFSTFTGAMPNPACWSEGTGVLGATDLTLTGTTSTWANVNYNNAAGPNGTAVHLNLYGTDREWFVSPAIDLGDGSTEYQLEFLASVTPYTGTAPVTAMAEKFVKVVVSTDGGLTWNAANVIRTFDNDNIPSGGAAQTVLLDGYTGVVKIGFYAYSTTTAPDLRFYIDNFRVIEVPSCIPPSAVTVSNPGENNITIGWNAASTAPADGYQYYIGTAATAPIPAQTPTGSVGAGILTANAGSLTASTTYYVWVRSNCDTDLQSEWVGGASFTTLCDGADVLTTTPGTVCGQGTVDLAATGSADAVLNWYTTATGGSMIGSGSPFTTPVITETTDYYVGAGNIIADSDVTVGAGGSTSTSAGYSPYYHGYGGNKTQFIVRASELNAAGIYAGPINSVSFTITSLGTPTFNNFAVSIGSTDQNAAAIPHIDGLTTVYTNAAQPLTMGENTYVFTTPFVWDGMSNIVVQTCYSNVNYGGSGSAVQYDTVPFVSTTYSYADNQSAAAICAITGSTGSIGYTYTGSNRAKMTFNATAICEGQRTLVTATVTDAPAIVAEASEEVICAGDSTDLSVTSANDGYTYMWTPGDFDTAEVTVSPAATTTYTVTATDEVSGCVTTETVTITVNVLPTALVLTDDTTVCEGETVALTATGATTQNTILTEGFNGATNSWTTVNNSTGGTPANAAWTLRPDGYATGGPYHSNDNSQFYHTNSDAQGSGSTTSTILRSPSFSTVGYTSANVSFYHYFYEPSNNSSTGKVEVSLNGTDWVTLQTYNTTTGTAGAFASANVVLTAPYLNQPTVYVRFKFDGVWRYYWAVDNVSIAGQQSADITWSPSTGLYTDANATTPYTGQAGATVYAMPTAAVTTYTATATNPAGCSISESVEVTLTTTPAPEVIEAAQTFCSGATIADLDATGTGVKWYYLPTGGNAIASTMAVIDGMEYYASQTVDGCESVARSMVTATVTTVAAPTVAQNVQTFCNEATVADLDATGTGVMWYTAATGGQALEETAALNEGTAIYYASQTIDGCESTTRTAVSATLNVTDAPSVPASEMTVCNEGTVADLMATGTGVMWYADETGGTALAATTALEDGMMYYASQTINGCESMDRAMVAVTVNMTDAPEVDADTQTICGAGTVADLMATGTNIMWYADETGGTALASGTALVDGMMYYASQMVGGCESMERTPVTVEMNTTAAPEVTDAIQSFCTVATVADLMATGTDIMWYMSSTGGTAMDSAAALTDGMIYYASQTIDGCESTRTPVTAQVTMVDAPEGEETQVISVTNASDATIEDIVATGTGMIWYGSEEDAMNGNGALAAGTVLESGSTYYATQTIGDCTSAEVLAVTVEVVLGVKGFDAASFSYHPNPVKDVLNLSYSSDITSVSVFNLLGQQVIAKNVNSTEGKIDMSNLADGAYIVNVTAGSHVKTIKVIKKQ